MTGFVIFLINIARDGYRELLGLPSKAGWPGPRWM